MFVLQNAALLMIQINHFYSKQFDLSHIVFQHHVYYILLTQTLVVSFRMIHTCS